MSFITWFKDSWFQALQTLSIVCGLLFTAYTVQFDGKARKVENLLSITASHREIWSELYNRPALERILLPSANIVTKPVTRDEEMFVHLVFLHAGAAYQAIKEKLFEKPHGLEADLGMFLSLPIPEVVWERMRTFYQPDFVRFVESCPRPPRSNDGQPFSGQ